MTSMDDKTYWAIQKILDDVLGGDAGDGAGEGIVADVALLAKRYREALHLAASSAGPPAAEQFTAAELREQLQEADQVLSRMSALLTQIAAALKGEPPELATHDWSDLPELARRCAEQAGWPEVKSDR
jgi:hypothetical protein